MHYVTEQQPILRSPPVRITVKSAASRYIKKKLKPQRDTLLFVWGTSGTRETAGWQVTACPMEDLPEDTLQTSLVTKLGDMPLVIPQQRHAPDLDGRTLRYKSGVLELA